VADPTLNSVPTATPPSPISVDDFAAKVKAKYPDYAGLDNATLAQKIVAKHPEYKNQVNLAPPAVSPILTDYTGKSYQSLSPADASEKMKSGNYTLGPPAQKNIRPLDTPKFERYNALSGGSLGVLRDVGRGVDTGVNALMDMPGQVVHAFSDAPSTPEEATVATPSDSNPFGGTGALATKRLLLDPMAAERAKAAPDLSQGHTSEAVGHSVAGAIPMLGPFAAHMGEAAGENPMSALGEGLVYGGVPKLVGDVLKPTPNPLARITSPTQESAFNVLHPENAVAKESILPTVRNAAAQQGITKVPKGKAGVELPQRVIQGSIDNHEAQVVAIKEPYRGAVVDNSAASNAALSKITPEMRIAAKTDSSVAKAVAQIEAVAERARGANTVDLVDQLRHSWNDELSSELGKSAASQDVSPAATQAKRVAATALRKTMYDRLAELSGREDVRALAKREGALIEAKAGVEKTATNALKSRRNDLGEYPRATALKKAALQVQLTRPATIVKAIPDIVQAILNPEAKTPVGQYAARVKRSLGNLGPAEAEPPLYQAPPNTPLTTPSAPLSPTPGEDIIEEIRRGGPGTAPIAPDTSQTFVRPGTTPQVVADQLNAARSGRNTTARVEQHKVAKSEIGSLGGGDQYELAKSLSKEFGKASTSLLQRRLKIGYAEASSYVDKMRAEGLVGNELVPAWKNEIKNGGVPDVVGNTIQQARSTPYSLTPEENAPLNFQRNGEPGGFNTIDLNLNGKKVGYASVGGNPYVKPGALEVKNIKIENPELHGQGHGTKFYEHLAEFARQNGADSLMSDVQRKAGAEGVWNKLAAAHPGEVTFSEGRWHWDFNGPAISAPGALEPRVTGVRGGQRVTVPRSQLSDAVRDGFAPDEP
jgi:hypothetical protein